MNETASTKNNDQEKKTPARQDYEAGLEFIKNKETAQAANAFHNALIGFEQENDENGIANASDKLGDICAERGDHATALTHFDRAYAICNKHSDRFSLFAIEKKKAKLAWDAKDLDQAIKMYLEIIDEYTALRNPQGLVGTLETLATIYLEKGDKGRAADSYRLAASIHKNFKHSREADEFLKKAEEVENS